MPPRGKRRANALVTRDAFELLRLVDGEGILIDDAMKQLKLSRSRAYDLLARARSAVLRSHNEANKKAAEVNTKRWYEAAPEPDTVIPFPVLERIEREVSLPPVEPTPKAEPVPDVQPVAVRSPAQIGRVPTTNSPSSYHDREPASGCLSSDEFITLPDGTKRRIRPQEPTADIYEWSHVMDYSSFRVKTPWRQAQLIAQWKENEALGGKHTNLRGGIKNRNCFRGCPSYQCTCEDNL
jgi:predicted DNA-binding protein (UPF0251 family)